MQIFHGDNFVQSRTALQNVIDSARENKAHLVRLQAKKLNLATLEEKLGSTSLFGTPQLIIVEELHSLPTSKRKKELITTLANFSDHPDLVLWEKRALTATMLKKFPQAKDQLFKTSNKMFAWLDSINGQKRNLGQQHQLLMEAIKQDGEHYCLMMLARQIRILLEIKEGSQVKGAPFMITKMRNQAQTFTIPQLLKLHQGLVDIDTQMKSSQNKLSLAATIDLLLLNG